MRVFVTGGGGFLGREIVNHLLERGYTVRSIGRTEQPELMALGCIRLSVICLMALRCACGGWMPFSWRQRRVYGVAGGYYQPNFIGTRNVVEGCLAEGS